MMMWMMAASVAWGCEDVKPTPSSLQVAWISPVGRTARPGKALEVVRVQELRGWIRANGTEQDQVLAALGMLERGESAADVGYKITIFDVQSDWLCRPLADAEPGSDVAGVAACMERGDRHTDRDHRDGFTGCGYTLNTYSSSRGIDVFRVPWSDASAWGFCVMPLERFLQGA
jgi:hypothetical protein